MRFKLVSSRKKKSQDYVSFKWNIHHIVQIFPRAIFSYSTTWQSTYEVGSSIQKRIWKVRLIIFSLKVIIHSSKLDSKPWCIGGESVWLSMGITFKNDTYIHCLFQIQHLVDLPFLFLYESNYLWAAPRTNGKLLFLEMLICLV